MCGVSKQVEAVPTRCVSLARGMGHSPLLAEGGAGAPRLVRKVAGNPAEAPTSPAMPLYPWASKPSL
jgi:hypothetical protein